jgi:hypothetical protein
MHTTRNQRHLYANEIRRQILWEAIEHCKVCRAFWQRVTRLAEEGRGAKDQEEATR